MKTTTQVLKVSKTFSFVVSGYFKPDLPTGENIESSSKNTHCNCGESKNKPFCDESYTKCFHNTYNSWF